VLGTVEPILLLKESEP